MSGVEVRKAGQRRPPKGAPGASLLGPTLGIHTNDPGERRLNGKMMFAIENLYNNHPAVAARSFCGQLLGGGIGLNATAKSQLLPAFSSTS